MDEDQSIVNSHVFDRLVHECRADYAKRLRELSQKDAAIYAACELIQFYKQEWIRGAFFSFHIGELNNSMYSPHKSQEDYFNEIKWALEYLGWKVSRNSAAKNIVEVSF
jgi:hypothetical protein